MAERSNHFLRSLNPVSMNRTNNNTSNNNQIQSVGEKIETDKSFLERTHVKSILDALLDSLCKNQPEDSINYICTYFDSLNQQEDLLVSALERLKLINYSSPVFDDCVLSLYNTINKMIRSSGSKKSSPKLQVGEVYNNIVDTLISEMPNEIREICGKMLKKREYDAISFEILRSNLKIISIFKEFLNQSRSLFKQLEIYANSERVNKILCLTLLQQISSSFEVISTNNKNKFDNTLSIESLYELSPTGIIIALEEKYEKHLAKATSQISCNDFLQLAAQVFFQQVSLSLKR